MFFEIRSYLKDKTVKKPFIIPVQHRKNKKSPRPNKSGRRLIKLPRYHPSSAIYKGGAFISLTGETFGASDAESSEVKGAPLRKVFFQPMKDLSFFRNIIGFAASSQLLHRII